MNKTENEQITRLDTTLNTPYNVNAGESHRLSIKAEARFMPVAGLELKLCCF